MTLLDAAFVAVLVAPVLGPLTAVVIAACRPSRRTWWLLAGAAVATTWAWLAYWYFWGIAFDYVDTGRRYSTPVELGLNASMVVCAIGCGVLVVLALRQVRARISDGREPTRADAPPPVQP